MTGYLSDIYAKAFEYLGTPIKLKKSEGWIIERKIPQTEHSDGMGCYPIFMCENYDQIENDLNEIDTRIVSLYLVTDPFGEFDPDSLKACFEPQFYAYKTHYIADLSQDIDHFVCSHHKRNAKKALRNIHVSLETNPMLYYDDWINLYKTLIRRHGIKGIQVFSGASFQRQFEVPGLIMFRGTYHDRTVGIILWYRMKDRAYYHLGAFNEKGYELKASFALFWKSYEYFQSIGLRYLNMGSSAGIKNDVSDGLARFKKGWTSMEKTAYFCGRIFNSERYSKILRAKNIMATDYFPAYRKGECE